jgi:hypothetical protein
MRRVPILIAFVAVVLAGGFAGARAPGGVVAQDASPAAEEFGPPPGVAAETLAFGMVDALPVTPAMIFLDRLTIDPGVSLPAEPGDPNFAFTLVESGSLTILSDTPLAIARAAALAEALESPGTMPEIEETTADTDVTLSAGDSIVFPPEVGGELRNDGTEPVVLLGVVIAPVDAMMESEEATPEP